MSAPTDSAELRPARPAPQDLAELLEAVPGLRAIGDVAGVRVTGCTLDSRKVRPGDLYAAVPGANAHGASFAAAAVAAGAVAVLTDDSGAARVEGAPVIVAADVRAVLGRAAAWAYAQPAQELSLLGVTGTNGKTTTAFMMEAGLKAAGRSAGLLGTIMSRIGSVELASARTTPEAPELQGMFALMREQRVDAVAMELSSHALAVGRVDGCRFDAAVFTNFNRDHLEVHATMEDYFAAKASLFRAGLAARGIINADDPAGRRILAAAQIPMTTFGLGDGADWRPADVVARPDGSDFRLLGPGVDIEASVALAGDFNVMNAVAAIAALASTGVPVADAVSGIAAMPGIPGHMEPIEEGQDFTALVDFAHTPEAVERLLQAVRTITSGRVIVVLGCGGDRDPGKRPLMGKAAVAGADLAVFTSDNPRSEDPHVILAAMGPGGVTEADRRVAIAYAVSQAQPGDTVVIAGKGHETGQEVAGVVTAFDDREVLRESIREVIG